MRNKIVVFTLYGALSLCVLGVIGSALIVNKVSSEIDKATRKYTGPRVLGLPSDYDPYEHIEPYSGLHPSLVDRPKDSFSYPIKLGEVGPIKPLFSINGMEYPFLCDSTDSPLGQPLVDNNERAGMAVFVEDQAGHITNKVIGYSKDCLFKSKAWYYYNSKGTDKFLPLEDIGKDQIEKIVVNGRQMDFIVRVEMGTINRFIYLIAALAAKETPLNQPNAELWNKKLIYGFRGGVGIGKRQGEVKPNGLLRDHREQLRAGYGFAYSSSNQTAIHYDALLAEDTAARVKRQFSALYGTPIYTVGIGGSGGAIQQYLIAQNNPSLLDAAIALYSYPDMVTQTIYALDCDLLEYYFDVKAKKNGDFWDNWANRSLIEGLSARNDQPNPLTELSALVSIANVKWPNYSSGISECAKSWRGPTQVIHNPRFAQFSTRFEKTVEEKINWTHWDNLKGVYGTDEYGFANSPWDNVGVQYGLRALKEAKIDIETFFELNTNIGGWKTQKDMKPLKLWYFNGESDFRDISIWSEHNMNLKSDATIDSPAPRSHGNIKAIEAAYRGGQVFVGKAEIPIIDLRHYLDSEMDMHHTFASLSVRKRMLETQGTADNQVIWVTEKPNSPIAKAFQVIDEWMSNIKAHPEKNVVANKPTDAVDGCFDADDRAIATGDHVWDGDWNDKTSGTCLKHYPPYSSSRFVAGGDMKDEIFKCSLQTIEQAIDRGVYGSINILPYAQRLKLIFPEGVCDYSKQGIGWPNDLIPQISKTNIALEDKSIVNK